MDFLKSIHFEQPGMRRKLGFHELVSKKELVIEKWSLSRTILLVPRKDCQEVNQYGLMLCKNIFKSSQHVKTSGVEASTAIPLARWPQSLDQWLVVRKVAKSHSNPKMSLDTSSLWAECRCYLSLKKLIFLWVIPQQLYGTGCFWLGIFFLAKCPSYLTNDG